MHSSTLSRAALGCALIAAIALPAAASAHSVGVDLRVEATNGKVLADVRQYTSPATVRSDPKAHCFGAGSGGSGDRVAVPNATALGLVADALPNVPSLRPLSLTDHFSFGLGVCGIGGRVGGDPDPFWDVTRDGVASQVGGDQLKVRDGDEILWYLAPSFPVGDELVLRAPARAKPGAPVDATVFAFNEKGKRAPAADATVDFASGPTNGAGHTTLTFPDAGTESVQANAPGEIPSNVAKVCVNATLSKCPAHHGRKIYGSPGADKIATTPGPDRIKAGAGADRISLRPGGADHLGCGPGRDVVIADRGDRNDEIGRSCEKVLRK
jgi:hemolysin type calcium-binding protein